MSVETQTTLASTRFTAAVESRVLDHIRRHRIFTPSEHVLVGVSGGPDSTALLVILSRLRAKLDINLTVAHFDHMLRTREEAEGDARFVTEISATLGVPLVTGASDVRASARRDHRSLEDAARRLRYEFFAEKAASTGVSCVSVGHTLDDQAETVLMHIIRGSGLDGLGGMRPRFAWPFGAGPDLARPLLALCRADTEQFCRELGIEPRTDPTNDLPIAARNRVRNELMPVLRRFNPRFDKAIARLAVVAASESGYLDELARSYFRDIASTTATAVSLSRRDLLAAHPAMARRIIRLALEQASGAAVDIEALHVETLLEALDKSPGSYSLPAGLTATTDPRSLNIHRGAASAAEKIPETKLSVPGEMVAGVWAISTELSSLPPEPSRVSPDEAYLDAEVTGCELNVRSRRAGDRLRPLGLGGEKKLQDILVDAKVPARERDGVLLVCVGGQIAWVVGHCIDERYAITSSTGNAIHILISRLPGE